MGASPRRLAGMASYARWGSLPHLVFLHSWAECKIMGRLVPTQALPIASRDSLRDQGEASYPSILWMGRLRLTEVMTLEMSVRTFTPYGH